MCVLNVVLTCLAMCVSACVCVCMCVCVCEHASGSRHWPHSMTTTLTRRCILAERTNKSHATIVFEVLWENSTRTVSLSPANVVEMC
jgi:hypothetical protein